MRVKLNSRTKRDHDDQRQWLKREREIPLVWWVSMANAIKLLNDETKVPALRQHQFQSFRTLDTRIMDKLCMRVMKTLINWIIRWSLQVKMIFQFGEAELKRWRWRCKKKRKKKWHERNTHQTMLKFIIYTRNVVVTSNRMLEILNWIISCI